MPQPSTTFHCQVLLKDQAKKPDLKKHLQLQAEFIESIEHFRNEAGSVWVLEVDDQLPNLTFNPLERPPLIVVLRGRSTSLYKKVLSRLKPDVILIEDELDQLTDVIEKLQAQLLVRSKKRMAERSIIMRNKELQNLAQDLERMVEERTQWIESSNREQKELIKTERQFVQFLIEISLKSSQEEVLLSFREQFRRLQWAQEVFLLQGNKIIFVSKSEKVEFVLPEAIWLTQDVESLNEQVSRTLAKVLSRPVGRLLVFPLPQFDDKMNSGLVIEKATARPLSDFDYAQIKKYTQGMGLSFERIKLEESNRVSALRWEKVFDGALDPVAIITENFEVVRSNQSFDQNPGQKRCYEIWAKRSEPCDGCPILNKMNQSEVHQNDHIFQVIQNKLNPESIYLHHYVDVTEARQNNIRFIQNEKLSAIGQIAEQMAHEIYNPLAGILALVQILLMDEKIQGTSRQDLEEIQKAASRAQKVIENLQDFVKEESDLTYSNLDEIVDKTLPLLKMKWRSYRLDLNLNASDGRIHVQPQLISQVVYNLIQNACQAMKNGQTLSIRTQVLPDRSQLIVEDEGMGIPENIQKNIFKPFFTTKKPGEGTGLGLSLSKQIAERFGGTLSFHSIPGKGTRFILELPIEK